MGFLKKLKDTVKKDIKKGAELGKEGIEKGIEKGAELGKEGIEKGIEKGAEVGTKGFESVKKAAKKGHEKAKSD